LDGWIFIDSICLLGFVRTSFSDSAWRHPNKFNPWWY
jgi:hypothetical protein